MPGNSSTQANKKGIKMSTYHTEGIVKDIHLKQDKETFTLEAAQPYAVEEKDGDKTEQRLLFVADAEDNQNKLLASKNGEKADSKNSQPRPASLVPVDACFEFVAGGENGNRIDMATLLFLKQNRSKIRIVLDENQLKDNSSNNTYSISEIAIK